MRRDLLFFPLIARLRLWLIAITALLFGMPALAFTPGSSVNTSYQGCNLSSTTTLTGSPTLICDDGSYTSGNLGKNWYELDLVPYRLTTSLGTQTGATTTYSLYIAADHALGGVIGFDVITVPIVNTAKSDPSCSVTAVGGQLVKAGITGGADDSIYRELQISQAKGSTCVFDWDQRLALGSHSYTGSSLGTYILTQVDFKGSNSTISLPVNQNVAQGVSKTMTASQNTERAWRISKTSNAANLDLGNVCADPSGPHTAPVQITVSWEKLATTPSGDVTVVTTISAYNPAHRSLLITVTDKIYTGTDPTGTLLATNTSDPITVEAGKNGAITSFTTVIPAAQAGDFGSWLNDVVTASYSDPLTGVSIPLTTTAAAEAQIRQGATLNETANISDLERIVGTGLSFSVAAPSTGFFTDYTAGAFATRVNWGVMSLMDSGSVTFNKTISLDTARIITNGTLDDTATLVTTDTDFTTSASLATIGITSSAQVTLTVNKTLPFAPTGTQTVAVNFTVTPAGGTSIPLVINFDSSTGASAHASLTNLAPGSYTVVEVDSVLHATAGDAGTVLPLQPTLNNQVIDLSPRDGGIMDADHCDGIMDFVNQARDDALPTARVQKTTLPAQTSSDPGWSWNFTLTGPSGFTTRTATAQAGQGPVAIGGPLTLPGTYTVTETPVANWDLTNVTPNSGGQTCTFTVSFPASYGTVYSCAFTNVQRGAVKVVKTLSGQALTGQQFTFQLRKDATANADGTVLETLTTNTGGSGSTLSFTTALLPTYGTQTNTYQLCEATQAGWMTSFNDPTSALFVPGAFVPPGTTVPNTGVDNSWLCVNFTVDPGQTRTFNIDNSPPPGGRALTIGYWKTHASCTTSSTKKAPALDATLFGMLPWGVLGTSEIESLARPGSKGLYGQTATSTVDCAHAVSLLDKRDFNGTKKASDPLFNMAAQLVAAQLNLGSGAYTCVPLINTVTQANALLDTYDFKGSGYSGKLSKTDAALANSLATTLDNYNNNRTGVCP